jgi:hypothetical protein
MTHLDEEHVVSLCFGDGTAADAAHVAECAECAAAVEELRAMLASVDAGVIPERGEDYGALVWERLSGRLEFERRSMRRAVLRRRAITWGALAASLLVAFLAGRHFPPPPPPVAQAIPEAARERILLLAVGDHLERSQVLLVELSNAGPGGPVDMPAAQESAEALVSANRLYRASALSAGDTGVASVLGELERVLVEVARQPPGASAKQMERIRKRIEDRGLLFKVRVIESQVRERGNDGPPPPAIHSQVS